MKVYFIYTTVVTIGLFSSHLFGQPSKFQTATVKTPNQSEQEPASKNLYIDVHHLGAGKVTLKDVQAAHQKDLGVQKKHGVNMIKYWFDEKKGVVMCLAQAPNADSLINTHKEAHGLVPVKVVKV